ncbi:MAG: AbrB/MazE/SpoVT family DNA-binding domain-containing protein [Candidatus Woesebacteria bacterium]|nr:MAG: AbrB/MazE/SpoVT family DNA-binding domain-containing protein [Candidatus Woesebacteria bacterium]
MNYISSVTQKGQTTIPLFLRKKLGIEPKGKVRFEINEKDEVVIKPIPSFFAFQGSVNPKKLFDIDAMDRSVGEHLKREYEKKSY